MPEKRAQIDFSCLVMNVIHVMISFHTCLVRRIYDVLENLVSAFTQIKQIVRRSGCSSVDELNASNGKKKRSIGQSGPYKY